MSRKNIIIIIILSAVIFILLLAFLFFNSYLDRQNLSSEKNIKQNQPTETAEKNNIAITSGNNIVSSTEEAFPGRPTNADISKIKAITMKQLAASSKPQAYAAPDVYKTVADCAGLANDSDKIICYTAWAEYEKDPGVCLAAPEANRQSCQDGAYLAKAIANKDISLCAGIKDSDEIRTCVFDLVDLTKPAVLDCMKLPDNEAELCLTEVTLSGAASSADCEKIVDAKMKQLCLNYFYANLPLK